MAVTGSEPVLWDQGLPEEGVQVRVQDRETAGGWADFR